MAEDGKRTYSAKQVATRIGTDAKQLRKFLRDPNSGYIAVGQGGRYDFPEEELVKIQAAFDTWNSTKTRRNRAPSTGRTPASAVGLIPTQRRDSPARPPRRTAADEKAGLHGNALDGDTLQDRFAGIAARVQRHGLVSSKSGRLVPQYPASVQTIPSPDEGLTTTPEPQILDFSEVEDDIQDLLDDPEVDEPINGLGLSDEGGGEDSADLLVDWELGLDEVDED